MTATDELRARLDALGIDWDFGPSGPYSTAFRASGMELSFVDWEHGLLCSTIFTPAQAIEATLGRGECRPVEEYLDMHSDLTATVCSNCRVAIDDLEDCNYCPNCGCKVVDE